MCRSRRRMGPPRSRRNRRWRVSDGSCLTQTRVLGRAGRALAISWGAMVERTIEYFSYGGLLIILLLASLGLPVPEEVPIVTAGILSHQGAMRWWLALPTCIAGVLGGDLILYVAGRSWGERVREHRLL